MGNGILNQSLFQIHLINDVPHTLIVMHGNAGIKRCVMNEKSSYCGIEDWVISQSKELKDF